MQVERELLADPSNIRREDVEVDVGWIPIGNIIGTRPESQRNVSVGRRMDGSQQGQNRTANKDSK